MGDVLSRSSNLRGSVLGFCAGGWSTSGVGEGGRGRAPRPAVEVKVEEGSAEMEVEATGGVSGSGERFRPSP